MTRVNYSNSDRNRLSDRDIYFDLLTTEKYMSHFYDHAVLESSDDLVRETFQTLQHSCHSNGQKLYETMYANGWYNNKAKQSRKPAFDARLESTSKPFRKEASEATQSERYINPGLNRSHKGKTGIFTKPPRYVEHFNTPQ